MVNKTHQIWAIVQEIDHVPNFIRSFMGFKTPNGPAKGVVSQHRGLESSLISGPNFNYFGLSEFGSGRHWISHF